MKANCWYGKHDVRVENVPDPKILNPRDAIVRITSTAICGSDLHLYDGYIPDDVPGRHPGPRVHGRSRRGRARRSRTSTVGDRVVVPFPISCGTCFFCKRKLFSLCDNSNPNAWMAEKLWGHSPAGLFGYSHMLRRLCRRAGGIRARAVRRRRADQNARRPDRRPGVVPVGHLPDRLHGRRELSTSSRRYGRGLGCGPSRTVRDRRAPAARRGARDRDRSLPGRGWDGAAQRRRARRSTTKTSTCCEALERDHRRSRTRRLHRRRRHGSARARRARHVTIASNKR